MGEISEKAFPFDSEQDHLGNYDREYFADDFARYFRAFISSGLFMENTDSLQIIANDDMTVTLRPGNLIINGYRYENTNDIVIPIEPADGVMNRIDRIAITWIKEERDIHKTVQKGVSSYLPIAPECRRTEEYKDYVLADIYIPAGAIKVTQDHITDQRLNSEVCGLAIAFSKIDTTLIFNQLQAFYEKVVAENATWTDEKKLNFDKWVQEVKDWFESVKDTLTSVENGELLIKIEGMLRDMYSLATDAEMDAIINGSYVDDDEGSSIFETASDDDIDEIINGTYIEDNDSEPDTEDEEILEIINSTFMNL